MVLTVFAMQRLMSSRIGRAWSGTGRARESDLTLRRRRGRRVDHRDRNRPGDLRHLGRQQGGGPTSSRAAGKSSTTTTSSTSSTHHHGGDHRGRGRPPRRRPAATLRTGGTAGGAEDPTRAYSDPKDPLYRRAAAAGGHQRHPDPRQLRLGRGQRRRAPGLRHDHGVAAKHRRRLVRHRLLAAE